MVVEDGDEEGPESTRLFCNFWITSALDEARKVEIRIAEAFEGQNQR